MFGHKVKVESPLELEPKGCGFENLHAPIIGVCIIIVGKEMISSYFVPGKFVAWKSRQYSIFKLYH